MPIIQTRPGGEGPPRNCAGTAAIEFALLGPLLLILLVGAVELGFAMYQSMQVYNAVEAGAVYATKNGWNSAGISSAVVNGSTVSGMTAVPAPAQFCGCPLVSGITVTACAPSATCTGGSAPGEYVRISATLPRMTILPVPDFGLPATLRAQSIVRLN